MMPFPGGLDGFANGALILSLAAAIAYLPVQDRQPSLRRSFVKTATTALLALLAFMEGGPLLLAGALALSAAGDAFLAQEGEKAFLAGLASFLAAHIAYVVLFLLAGGGLETLAGARWRFVLCAFAIAAAIFLLRHLLPAVGRHMRLPVTFYTIAILAMLLAAATVAAPAILIGALLFVISDTLLAIGRFLLAPQSPRQLLLGKAVWISYYLAQAAITLGFLL